MRDSQLIAGLPLGSWLMLIAAVLLAGSVASRYSSTHAISWVGVLASALCLLSALMSARRARRPGRDPSRG